MKVDITSDLYKSNDRAVSPVIGVILMVAITVILAAVIGTFVLGLGDDLGESAQAGVTVNEIGGEEVTVQLTNGGNADEIRAEWSGWETDSYSSDESYTFTGVGDSVTVDVATSGSENAGETEPGASITVIGVLNGEETVIRTYHLSP